MIPHGFMSGTGLDRYSLMARLRPALLAVLPAVLVIGYWMPTSVLTGAGLAMTTLTTCGLTYFLAMVARAQGLALERRLGERVGRLRSARMLTFADEYLVRETKLRYHGFLSRRGCVLSTEDEERGDPKTAFERARSAVDRLLVLTKQPQQDPRLFHETISYGFARNLRGLKPIALALLVILMVMDNALVTANWHDRSTVLAGFAIEAVLLSAAAVWVFLVTENWVCSASTSYAHRFLECCEGD